MVVIDGSHGEGGGAVVRGALSLSAVLGEPIRIENIRVKRPNPGLQAQHLTGVRAMATVSRAQVHGAELGSHTLSFAPGSSPRAGDYSWDVAKARKGGSAGATSLIFQALLLPLLMADGDSRLFLRGGTHVAWSPPFHYLKMVYLPMLARMGIEADVNLEEWGWYPIGGGTVTAQIAGAAQGGLSIGGLELTERGELRKLYGISALSNLPGHIAERQKRQAEKVLKGEGFEPLIEIVDAPSRGRGTAVFLLAEFEKGRAGFTSLGRKGKPAEKVAEEACVEFLEYYRSGAAVDRHLGDQLILPMALAQGNSSFTTCRITQHLLTNVWVVEQFLGSRLVVEGKEGAPGKVTIRGGNGV
jgi:RNA 3'-terminal phosphate cyclase (ATP)